MFVPVSTVRRVDTHEHVVEFFFVVCRAFSVVYIDELVSLYFGEELGQRAHRLVLLGRLEQLQGFGDAGPCALGVRGHFVHAVAVILVLQLAQRFHASVEIVVNDGVSVLGAFEGFPAFRREALRAVDDGLRVAERLGFRKTDAGFMRDGLNICMLKYLNCV